MEKVIDLIRARLDSKTDSFVVELPSLHLKDVRINDKLVNDNDRMLTGGFYAEVDLGYDGAIAQEKSGRPFSIDHLREIQLSKANVLDVLVKGRVDFGFEEWKRFLLRSIGLEPELAVSYAFLVFITFFVAGGLIGAVAFWFYPLKLEKM